MTAVRWIVLASVALLVGGAAYDAARRRDAAAPPVAAAGSVDRAPALTSPWTGSASCIGRSCHGGIEPRTDGVCRQDEYATIAVGDPHSRAYLALLDERSRDIVRRLGRADGDAHRDRRCLACHATPLAVAATGSILDASEALRASETAFGVGCESCHSAARDWLHRHYRKPTGEPAPTALDRTAVRAAQCASCHVGSPESPTYGDRSVDHDLIAAGHPRLLFEFVSLQEAMPAHWRPKPRDAAHDWFVGQIAGAKAALGLLHDRLSQLDRRPDRFPWPEFAEFDCFACHHDLKAKSWRQRGSKGRKPGTLPWNSWTFDVVVRLLDQHGLPTGDWIELRRAMETSSRDCEAILESLGRARVRLDELSLRAAKWNAATMAEFLKRPDWAAADNWEAVEQYYFALRALKSAGGDAETVRRLEAIESKRGFERGYQSPRRFDPSTLFEKR